MNYEFHAPPALIAEFSLQSDFFVRFGATRYPNALHRFMQRWLLGIYWRKLP